MTPFLADPDVELYLGDSLEVLRGLPDRSVHMCCCSPPFYGLRDYGTGTWEGGDDDCDHVARIGGKQGAAGNTLGKDASHPHRESLPATGHALIATQYRDVCGKCGARRVDQQIGLEETPDLWVARLVEVFREVKRVLRDDATLWLELGDSFGPGKQLRGTPWRLAFALQDDGWSLRSEIIWSRPNPMPESVSDRPTTSHSRVFLLAKQPRYFYDAEAIREPHQEPWRGNGEAERNNWSAGGTPDSRGSHETVRLYNPAGRNRRSVWTIATQRNSLAVCGVCFTTWETGAPPKHCGQPVTGHYAAFPEKLVEPMILAGTSEHGVCPECGAPWERIVSVDRQLEPGRRELGLGAATLAVPRPGGGNPVPGITTLHHDRTVETTGWRPTCLCGQLDWHSSSLEPVPAVVLDPFAGSGTTALVARRLGRRSIGIDLNREYLELAARRLQQLSLFAAAGKDR